MIFSSGICLSGLSTDDLLELTYLEKKRIHNLKYFTWVEQQQRDVGELNGFPVTVRHIVEISKGAREYRYRLGHRVGAGICIQGCEGYTVVPSTGIDMEYIRIVGSLYCHAIAITKVPNPFNDLTVGRNTLIIEERSIA